VHCDFFRKVEAVCEQFGGKRRCCGGRNILIALFNACLCPLSPKNMPDVVPLGTLAKIVRNVIGRSSTKMTAQELL